MVLAQRFSSVVLLASILMLSGLETTCSASGRSPAGAPRVRRSAPVSDDSQYELGKSVFKKSIPFSENQVLAEEQSSILQEIQSKLPNFVQKDFNPSEYAGRVTADQLKALVFYLKKRFRIQ